MFKHILLPTDGSSLANKAAEVGIGLAIATGARITICYVIEPVNTFARGNPATPMEFERTGRDVAKRSMARAVKVAKKAGMVFEEVVVKAEAPHAGIVALARKRKCDAICMASHSRRGLPALVLGSVTQKVLAACKVPVLVCR